MAHFTFDTKGTVRPFNSTARAMTKGVSGLHTPGFFALVDERLAWLFWGFTLAAPTLLFHWLDLSVPVLDWIFSVSCLIGMVLILAAIGGFMTK